MLAGKLVAGRSLTLVQSQPLGNQQFYAKIEQMKGIRREPSNEAEPHVDTARNTLCYDNAVAEGWPGSLATREAWQSRLWRGGASCKTPEMLFVRRASHSHQ